MGAFGLAILCAFFSACVRDAPQSTVVEVDELCAGTGPGHACIRLRFSISDEVSEELPGDLSGVLHWALYEGGAVGLFGPGDKAAAYTNELASDMTVGDAPVVYVQDVVAGPYQVLAYLDDDEDGTDSSGDPVTFPSEAFQVRADRLTRVEVVFDWIR